jgi:predicted nicotinamide N-methyase
MSTAKWIETAIGSPADRPHEWVTEKYRFGGREILLARPINPDVLLDDPAVQSASRETDYMPYWAYVWPGALLLAERLSSHCWPRDWRAIEIGCGLGLAGLAALATGLHVTFSDYSPAALALARYNASLNGFSRFEVRVMDWQAPARETFELVLGADVLYESRCLTDVLRVLDATLSPGAQALLSDANRAVADPFESLAVSHGYEVACSPAQARASDGRKIQGRIFTVQRGFS